MKKLAEFLKTERLNRNLTLETVSERSGINMRMLVSLEACTFERFGASTLFIRNMVRAYCRVLEIEPEPVIRRFSYDIERYNIQDAGIRKYGQQMKLMKLMHKKRRMISLPLFALFLISAALFYGGMWVAERRSKLFATPDADRVFTQEEIPADLQERLAPGPSARIKKPGADMQKADEAIRKAEIHIRESQMAVDGAAVPENRGEQAGEAVEKDFIPGAAATAQLAFSNSTEAVADDEPVQGTEEENRLPNKFAVETDDDVWIEVTIDDKETQRAVLHAGDRMEWAADKDLQVVIGNAGGIHMTWNEHPLKAPRDPGRVLRFRLPDYAKAE
ncbi:MAG: RodZ domain-containing protein [Syntrophobacteraceae bacterium]|jgi:cytoskeletal protein RodZ